MTSILIIIYLAKYGGSWTWFTAVIVRQVEEAAPLIDGQTSVEDKIKNLLVENTSERTAAIGQDPKIVRVKNPVYDSYAWHIQRNVRAVGEHTKHEVVWTADASGSVPEERHIMDMKGAGSGVGFVQSLRMEDRIAVVARALVSELLISQGFTQSNVLYFLLNFLVSWVVQLR